MEIKIGTRGSKLALWQAYHIQDLLSKAGIKSKIIIIETKGDKILDRALSKIGSKGVFTEELEDQLRSGEIDIAVHSAKDLQSDLGDEFKVIAFTEREKTNDVIVSKNKNLSLKKGFVLGTSSTRRVALMKRFYPQVHLVDMRGNLQTRIKKMDDGACDALLLAYAGVHRMEYNYMIIHELSTEQFTPAVGQGSVAIECHKNLGEQKQKAITHACDNHVSSTCLKAERAFLKVMNGGCSIPVFGNATLVDDLITLNAGIVSLDGKNLLRVVEKGSDPIALGEKVATELLNAGGKTILEEIRTQQSIS